MGHAAKRADRAQVADIDAVSGPDGRPLRPLPVLACPAVGGKRPDKFAAGSWPNGSLLVSVATASQIRPKRYDVLTQPS